MITQQDLKQAIADCQGERNPNANTCIKLAAFLTIMRELYGEEKEAEKVDNQYSFAPANLIEIESNSEFAGIVNGQEQKKIMPVIDELMDTIKIIQPRLYEAVLDRLS